MTSLELNTLQEYLWDRIVIVRVHLERLTTGMLFIIDYSGRSRIAHNFEIVTNDNELISQITLNLQSYLQTTNTFNNQVACYSGELVKLLSISKVIFELPTLLTHL